jgi:hypothetical protein
VADLGTHQHHLLNWVYRPDSWLMADEGMALGDYFQFEADE